MEGENKRRLIVRFHTLLGAAGIDTEGKMDMLERYGVESSKDLDEEQLAMLCEFVAGMVNRQDDVKERARRRAIRAVCKFMDGVGGGEWRSWDDERKVQYAKGVVCRATGTKKFNAIGVDRLRSVACSFEKQRRDMDKVVEIAGEIIGGK